MSLTSRPLFTMLFTIKLSKLRSQICSVWRFTVDAAASEFCSRPKYDTTNESTLNVYVNYCWTLKATHFRRPIFFNLNTNDALPVDCCDLVVTRSTKSAAVHPPRLPIDGSYSRWLGRWSRCCRSEMLFTGRNDMIESGSVLAHVAPLSHLDGVSLPGLLGTSSSSGTWCCQPHHSSGDVVGLSSMDMSKPTKTATAHNFVDRWNV